MILVPIRRLDGFDGFMIMDGYSRSLYNKCVYYRRLKYGSFILLMLHIYDILIVVKNLKKVQQLKN